MHETHNTTHPLRRYADTHPDEMEELRESFRACPAYTDHALMHEIHEDLKAIKDEVSKMNEVLQAWNNAKGFIKTIRLLGEVAKWLVATGAAIAAIWWWIKR